MLLICTFPSRFFLFYFLFCRSTVVEMSDLEKDETPMLSEAHAQYVGEPRVSYSHGLISRGRSTSFSIPMNFTESYQNENNLVNHTGPLRNEKKIPFVQMSGPLFIAPKSEFSSAPRVDSHRKAEPRVEKFPSINGMEWNNQPHNNYAGKNEHLLRSGQLGVCNDAYCTVCPTHFIGSRQEKSSKVSLFPKLLAAYTIFSCHLLFMLKNCMFLI